VDLNYKVEYLFPSCVHILTIKDYESIKDELIGRVYEENNGDVVGNQRSNREGWQSKTINSLDDNVYSTIVDVISESMPVLKRDISFNMQCWYNINKKGSYNIKHNHPDSHLSGVLWLKAPSNCGNIVFESPHNFSSYVEIKSYSEEFLNDSACDCSHHYEPVEGKVLIFPSSLYHKVEPNKSDEDRISTSFNIKLINK